MVVDPEVPAVLANSTFTVGTQPVDVAIDPGTNRAIIVNQGSNNVSIFSLGIPRTAPQVLEVSHEISASEWGPAEVEVSSTLTTGAAATDQTLRIIGAGFVSGTSVVRLDGTDLATTFVSSRELAAIVPAAMLTAGPRQYAIDVDNSGVSSNAAGFTVIQSVDVKSAGCSTPAPQGVAIDSRRNLAVVSNPGCSGADNVAIINLLTGMGSTVAVGTSPRGVAVDPKSGLAVVANHDSNNASIVDVVANTVVATVSTDPGPTGVAIDSGRGQALVTANSANVVDTFTLSSSPGAASSLAVQNGPGAIAVDPARHVAAVANEISNSVSLVDLTQASATEHIAVNALPTGVSFDPVSGAFLVAASLNNRLFILDPISRITTTFRVGINPTSIAYNFASSTLVMTNSSSQTMTVVDFLSLRVRAVLSLRASSQFAVDIHPFSNLAVMADSAGNRVLLRPLPR
jgi:DNA-binding beta-propeller fold protein YncE